MAEKDRQSKSDGVSLVLCGEAGMGIQTVEFFLTRLFGLCGYNVFATKEYMSRVRGGVNSIEIRVSSQPVRAFTENIDLLIALNKGAIEHLGDRISEQTVVLAERDVVGDDCGKGRFVETPFTKTATTIGNKIYSNVVAVGAIAGLFGIDQQMVCDYVWKYFAAKGDDVAQKNIEAVRAGFALASGADVNIKIDPDLALGEQILLSGAEAVGLGAIAGGCDFISSYPMSPSTGVLVFLAKHGGDHGIIVEQAEDEIAAINMGLGAWYAGARAMVTTSGGGFALMTEGVSLAGMIESPMVIHLAQRPGPATGLPTRTEQGDLELALYAGHGEFPRIIFAPGTLEQAFYLTARAFNLADKYQVPVFILTDQYFLDSYYNTQAFDLSGVEIERHIVRTEADYKRYELTADGISPRGVPGFGDGLVCVDSDEHDEQGHITEDSQVRIGMVDKRLGKLKLIEGDIIAPELIGGKDYSNLVLCWGSTYHVAKEALSRLGRGDTSLLHFSHVYPLHEKTTEYLQKAEKTIIVEGNATGQLAKLIRQQTGIEIDEKILKYDGLCFSVEGLADELEKILD